MIEYRVGDLVDTPKKNPLKYEHLEDFVNYYHADNQNLRKETFDKKENPEGRWRKFSYEFLIDEF